VSGRRRADAGAQPCRTVILDSQNLRGAPVDLLARLVQERGFSLHVSAITLQELWAQAVRESKPGLLLNRVRTLHPVIDLHEPVKTAGVDLVRRLGGTVRGSLIPADGGDPGRLSALWHGIATRGLPDRLLAEGARTIERDAQDRAKQWMATIQAAATIEQWDGVTASPREIARRVTHRFFEMFGSQLSVPGGMHERFEGYYRAAGLHAAVARLRLTGLLPKPDENDAEDLQLLMHLGEGAFLATYDLNLIEHVDASGSFQAPWVRTIGELLTLELPTGQPWGKSARRAAAAHRPRVRSELRQLEERVRASRASRG
jgi:hypothetical protein